MTPEMYKEIQVETKGEFGGVGIQIGMKDNRLAVIAPIEGTPAQKAGIKSGDFIVKVNDETTKDLTLMEAVQKMRGPKGHQGRISRFSGREQRILAIYADPGHHSDRKRVVPGSIENTIAYVG